MKMESDSMYKKIISIFFILTILTSLVGCAFDNHNNDNQAVSRQSEKERVIEEAQKYLEDKYPDDKFTFVSRETTAFGVLTYYEMNFKSEKYSEATFKVYAEMITDEDSEGHIVSRYRDENRYSVVDYYDTYYNFLIRDDAEDYFDEKLKKYLGETINFKLEFHESLLTAKKLKNGMTFNDFIAAHGEFSLLCCNTMNVEEIEVNLKSLVLDLKDSEIYADLIYACIRENDYNTIQNNNLKFIVENCDNIFLERKRFYLYGLDADLIEFDLIEYPNS